MPIRIGDRTMYKSLISKALARISGFEIEIKDLSHRARNGLMNGLMNPEKCREQSALPLLPI